MNYTESVHRHRFAAWCASTAARRSRLCRFEVDQGFKIIQKVNLHELCEGWDKLPGPDEFDDWHKKTRCEMIDAAKEILPPDRDFTRGVAEKLINVYLKTLFIASPQQDLLPENIAKRNAIHPPIDAVLRDGLLYAAKQFSRAWKYESIWKNLRWSKLESDDYSKIIISVKELCGYDGLWTIEQYRGGRKLLSW